MDGRPATILTEVFGFCPVYMVFVTFLKLSREFYNNADVIGPFWFVSNFPPYMETSRALLTHPICIPKI